MLCLTIATALFANGVNAQTVSRVKADVPFAFVAGSTKLPAGQYEVDMVAPSIVRITTSDRSASAMLIVNASSRNASDNEGKLVFHKYGDKYFLADIWAPGTQSGIAVRPSALEKEMLAQKAPQNEVVVAKRR
jgi:hypothetical protein